MQPFYKTSPKVRPLNACAVVLSVSHQTKCGGGGLPFRRGCCSSVIAYDMARIETNKRLSVMDLNEAHGRQGTVPAPCDKGLANGYVYD
ncbi:DNA polymerase IV [Pseudomonas sp. St29]|nr:DNA polymerase IV [Pseudomonas sp. St29]